MQKPDLEKYDLPESSGVYFFMKGKDIFYIGKATSLKDRTRSYFAPDLIKTRGQHIVDMVALSDSIKYEATDSVLEALLLESALIKKHQPYYNTKEKDDKSYTYIIFTSDTLPRVLFARGKDLDFKNNLYKKIISFGEYFGPFPNGGLLRIAMRILRKTFPYLDEKTLKKDTYQFYSQLGYAPSTENKKDESIYKRNLGYLALFLHGKKSAVLEKMEQEMVKKAKDLLFEEAKEIRDQIYALTHIRDMSLIRRDFYADEEVGSGEVVRIESYDVAHLGGSAMVGVMCVLLNGVIEKKEYRTFSIKQYTSANDPGALREMLERRFGHPEWGVPTMLVVDGNEVQRGVAEKVLKEKNISCELVAVVKDERHRPKGILGGLTTIQKYREQILLANSEAHRFSLLTHTKKRGKEFLEKK